MKTGRNDPCPCGSGRKFKRCCATLPAVVAPAEVVADAPAAPAPADEVTAPPAPPAKRGGGRDWIPLQHQLGDPWPNRFGRKKPF